MTNAGVLLQWEYCDPCRIHQRLEIQIPMESMVFGMSTVEKSYMTGDFQLRFYCIHIKRMKDLERLKDRRKNSLPTERRGEKSE